MFNITPDNSIPNTDLDSVLLLYHGTHLKEALLHVGLEWHQILWRTLFVDDEAVSQQGYLGDNGSHSTAVTDLSSSALSEGGLQVVKKYVHQVKTENVWHNTA